MTNGILDSRRKGLEESFFARENERLKQKLREETQEKERREHLEAYFGKEKGPLIDRLMELKIATETVPALTLVPLIYVAWADNELEEKERAVILKASKNMGITSESPAYEILSSWLAKKPGEELMTAWKDYFEELSKNLDEEKRQELTQQILSNVQDVAESAGGILGVGAVSSSEKSVINTLRQIMHVN